MISKGQWIWLLGIGNLLLLILFIAASGERDMEAQSDMDLPPEPHDVYMNPPIPRKLDFAGEPVPLDDQLVLESLEYELILNVFRPHKTALMIKRAQRWKAAMLEILEENGIPRDFFFLMVAESSVSNATSPAGAQGFWQFMEGTAREHGLEVSSYVDERNHPIKATRAACEYLNKSYKRFGNWTNVAASYNMGMGGFNSSKRKQSGRDYYDLHLNPETARYVYRILALKLILSYPRTYGYKIRKSELYNPVKYKTVKVRKSISNLVRFAEKHDITYKQLRASNPWIRSSRLPVSSGKSYDILIPEETRVKNEN